MMLPIVLHASLLCLACGKFHVLPGRNEPRAVRQVRQCQLALVVLVSILTAVVIFFVSGELLVPFPVTRLVTSPDVPQDLEAPLPAALKHKGCPMTER